MSSHSNSLKEDESFTETIKDDFVEVTAAKGSEPALVTKISARHDSVGVRSPLKNMEFSVTLSARSLPEDDDSIRAPVDIVVCLDVSGSMSGRKLDLCKNTLALLLRELGTEDRFGLVSFGSQAKVELPIMKLSPESKEAALVTVQSLCTDGMTNMSGGIGLAAEQLHSIKDPHGVRSIFLLTDGHANQGVSDLSGIVTITKNCVVSPAGLETSATVHCFGYGQDHDSEMLRGISNATDGGTYYYVENDLEVVSAFGDALGGLLSVVAQNVTVNVSVPKEAQSKGVSILEMMHDRAVAQPDGSYNISIGDFYADETRDVILKTSLSTDVDENDFPHISATVFYMDTIQKKFITNEAVHGFVKRPPNDRLSLTNRHVALQCIRIKTTRVIAATRDLADKNELEKARNNITEYMNNLKQEVEQLEESSNPLIIQLIHELDVIKAGLLSQHTYQTTTGKYMDARMQTHSMQRCAEAVAYDINNVGNVQSLNVYRSKKKGLLSNKMRVASENQTNTM